MTEENRRATDPLLIEVHGMLTALNEKMTNHIEKDDGYYLRTEILEKGIEPLKNFHEGIKTARNIGLIIGTPILLGIGTGFWFLIKKFFTLVSH